jgi:hypothetical protein
VADDGPHRKHCSSTVACIFVAAGTCLPSRCLETVAVYLPMLRMLRSNGCTRYNIKAELKTSYSKVRLLRGFDIKDSS